MISAYGDAAGKVDGKYAGKIARAICEGFAAARAGARVRPSWSSEGLDEAGLHAWFQDKIDGLINLKAGLRSDGASKKTCCSCWCCRDLRHLRKLTYPLRGRLEHCCHGGGSSGNGRPDGVVHEVGEHCRAWGGRKWEQRYQTGLHRDQWQLRDKRERRVAIYQFETPEIRARFSHLLSDRAEF